MEKRFSRDNLVFTTFMKFLNVVVEILEMINSWYSDFYLLIDLRHRKLIYAI